MAVSRSRSPADARRRGRVRRRPRTAAGCAGRPVWRPPPAPRPRAARRCHAPRRRRAPPRRRAGSSSTSPAAVGVIAWRGGDHGGGVGVARRRRDALHGRPRLVQHLMAVGGQRLGAARPGRAPSAGCPSSTASPAAHSPTAVGASSRRRWSRYAASAARPPPTPCRRRRRGRRTGERARRRTDEVEQSLGVVDAALYGRRGQTGLERLRRVGEELGDAGQPALQGRDALAWRTELAHSNGKTPATTSSTAAGWRCGVRRSSSARSRRRTTCSAAKASTAAPLSSARSRGVRRRSCWCSSSRRRSRAAADQEGRRPAPAASQRRAEHGVVGDEVVEQRAYCGLHLVELVLRHAASRRRSVRPRRTRL